MKKKILWSVAGVLGLLAIAIITHILFFNRGRLTTEPEYTDFARTVSGSTISSPFEPDVLMEFDSIYKHIGGQKFILYGVADTEQHFFVEEHPDGSVKSLFWLQFEAYLPDNNYTYDYTGSPLRIQSGDFLFYTDTAVGKTHPLAGLQPGSDGYLARRFTASNGYPFPDEYAYARLVHMTDETNRAELMIIFVEDLAPTGFSAAELREEGEHRNQWADIETAHLDKFKSVLRLTRQ